MKVKIISLVLPAVIAAGIVLSLRFLVFSADHVPSDFTDARVRGAAIAENVMVLSKKTLGRLDAIAEHDRNRRTAEALLLVSQEVLESGKMREEAARLASQLERMARALPSIKPEVARQLATEAISAEVALVSRLMTHNALLAELFDILKMKLESRASNVDGRVNELINQINSEAGAINQFNKRFRDALEEFDRIVEK